MMWPDIPFEEWEETGNALHMWLQIAGKFRMAQTPWINHSWQAAFYVTARGLTSGLIPSSQGVSYSIDFDFIDQAAVIHASMGQSAHIELKAQSVADFHSAFLAALADLGAPTQMHGAPNEVADAIPFAQQTTPVAYDAQAAKRFWEALVQVDRVFSTFRTSYLGKVSPVHLFWGSLDLAVTRFSGRPAPMHPGGIPNLPDDVTQEAYSHEVSSAGFWAGGGGLDHAAFYSYAYPTPAGFSDAPLSHPDAYFHADLGEFILPYDSVRDAQDPDAVLLTFLSETYEAAATTGAWPRDGLDCAVGKPGRVRSL
ncbi:MAG: DUF5996 family protein [Pseudomonadota bacterium]